MRYSRQTDGQTDRLLASGRLANELARTMKLGTETAGIKVWIGRVCNVAATSSVLVNDPSEPDTDIISIGSYHRSV